MIEELLMNWSKWWEALRTWLADLGSTHCTYPGEEVSPQTRDEKQRATTSREILDSQED